MTIIPILTEKSMSDAKEGKYTFWVDPGLNKYQIKELIGRAFGVTVKSVRVMKKGPETKRTMTRHMRNILSSKKAIVTLGEKEKIDLFEEVKKGKKKTKK